MATSMRPDWAMALRTASSTEASLVTSHSIVKIESDSLLASASRSAAFLAFLPWGSRIVAKTVWPLRARVSANRRPNPVLAPVMKITCLESILKPPCIRIVSGYGVEVKWAGVQREEFTQSPMRKSTEGRETKEKGPGWPGAWENVTKKRRPQKATATKAKR